MVGIKLPGTGELSANDMYQEYQWIGTNGNIFHRPPTGPLPYRIDTTTLNNATNIPLANAPYVIYDELQLSLVTITINGTPIEILLPYAAAYVQGMPLIIPELTTSQTFLVFDYDAQEFWLYEWGVLVTVTGTVSITYNNVGSTVAMANYNRTSLALGGVVPINNYNKGVGELLLNNSYSDYYGARRNPVVLATRVNAWNGGGQPYGRRFGCAGAGWTDGAVYVRQTASTYFYCSGAYADYNGGNPVTIGLWSASSMYDQRSGFLRDVDTGSISIYASGRDNTCIRVRTRATTFEGTGNPTKYEMQVYGGCKGVADTLVTDWTPINLFEAGNPPGNPTYNESITAPASVAVNQLYDMVITGGAPFSSFTYTQNGGYPIQLNLDATGSITFKNAYLNNPGSFVYQFTFAGSGNVKSVTTVAV